METNCTDIEIQRVLNRSLIFIPYPDNNSNGQNDQKYECLHIVSTFMYLHINKGLLQSFLNYNLIDLVKLHSIWI